MSLEDFYYPALEGMPYTRKLEKRLTSLIKTDISFWNNINNISSSSKTFQVEFDLYGYGELSLPKWYLIIDDKIFSSNCYNHSLFFKFGKRISISENKNFKDAKFFKDKKYKNHDSLFGELITKIFPYVRNIIIKSDGEIIKLQTEI